MTIRRLFPLALLAASLGAASGLHAETKSPKPATCVKFHGEVRARAYGYDHFVALESSCPKVATCAVSSDVNPEAQNVTIDPAQATEVATSLGVPASTFTPHVTCTLP